MIPPTKEELARQGRRTKYDEEGNPIPEKPVVTKVAEPIKEVKKLTAAEQVEVGIWRVLLVEIDDFVVTMIYFPTI